LVEADLESLLHEPLFQENVFRFDLSHTFAGCDDVKRTIAHEVHDGFVAKWGGPLVEFPQRDVERGQELLKQIAPGDRPFVLMHVREPGFYQDPDRTMRNGDVQLNVLGIQHLINAGYTVIRVGDASMSDISDLCKECGPHLIDYARSSIRSGFMDCFLMSQCAFFWGGSSGLTFLAYVMGKRVCTVNWYNANISLGFQPRDRVMFKKLRYKETGKLVPFSGLMRQPFKQNMQKDDMDKHHVYLETNSQHEILSAIQEFTKVEQDELTKLQKTARLMVPSGSYSHEAAGQFSETILKRYIEEGAFH